MIGCSMSELGAPGWDGSEFPGGSGGSSAADPTGPGSEQELEGAFRAPVVAGDYLWTANPESDRVARIHATSLEVELYEAGHGPTFLAGLPKGATPGGALVINEFSHDASVFLLDDEGDVATDERFDVQEGASAWAVSPEGRFAIAWSNFGDSSLSDVDGHQDMTLFEFSGSDVETWMLAVGYRPSEVFINRAETRAFAACDPGISVIDLRERRVMREIFLPQGVSSVARDIEFSPDGRLAIARSQGSAELLLIDTESGRIEELTLPGLVTDLDMSADGALAVAVVREVTGASDGTYPSGGAGEGGATAAPSSSLIALIDPTTVLDSPDYASLYTEQVVGSVVVAADASRALLYTNASDDAHLTILDPSEGALRVVDLKAPVRAAFLAEDGSFAVTLMAPPLGSKKLGAFALVPVLEALPPRIESTATAPEFVSVSHAAERALITTAVDGAGRAEAVLAHFPTLLVDRIALPSRPLAVGILPEAGRGFVSQVHDEGRVTFVDLDDGEDKTVTGFELAGKVVDQ